ncbi:MAG: Appr-1-p processing protein [Methyloprofundus sp.]|nr:Appr-1-p processing protein [Methyloprofundus sp.]
MIRYTQGNLLEAEVDALVNTVNTVGVMGKGIALMFKEAFPDNFKRYAASCKSGELATGKMFVTERQDLFGSKWIINFPTKQHWRNPTKPEWVLEGLRDLHDVIIEHNIQSIAIPPLGCGNGGLDWKPVKQMIETVLADLDAVDIVIYEPTETYQNVAKKQDVKKLTPARALIAELVRRYSVLGLECSLLEVQKLAWFLERYIEKMAADNPLKLKFSANRFGPYTNRLEHLLNAMDGSYLHCEKRIADTEPLDVIRFDDEKKEVVQNYLKGAEAKDYQDALQATATLIDGFESPLGMELLATVDWLIYKEGCEATLASIKHGLQQWPGGNVAAQRKLKLFDDRLLGFALERLAICPIG